MHKFFIRSVILLSLLPFPAIRAQRPVVLARQPVSYSIPFKPAGGKEAGYGNLILREMAKEVLKEPWLVEIRVNGQLEITAEKGNDGLLLACSFVQRRITGDTLFIDGGYHIID